MDGVGPTYCETLIVSSGSFPIEFVNTYTSFIPFLFGVAAMVWLVMRRERRVDLWMLAVLTSLTGLGSAWWHGSRTAVALAGDVFPGLFYFLLFLYLWPAYLFGKWRGALVFLGFFATVFLLVRLLPFGERNGPPQGLFMTTFIFACGLLYATYRKHGRVVWWGIAMIGSALTAAFFRTIDLETCDMLPFGTHFLWHIFLGGAAYLGVRFLSALTPRWSLTGWLRKLLHLRV